MKKIDWLHPENYVRKKDGKPIYRIINITDDKVILSFLKEDGYSDIEVYNLDGTFFLNHRKSDLNIVEAKK